MLHEDKVEEVVKDYIGQGRQFTSVDVANEVKTRGTWVRTSEVATYLHSAMSSLSTQYAETHIRVTRAEDNQPVRATLYLPHGSDPSDYITTTQHPMTPDEFRQRHGSATPIAAPSVAPAPQPDPASTNDGGPAKVAGTPVDASFSKFKFLG